MRLTQLTSEFNNGYGIRLSFWPEKMFVSIHDNRGDLHKRYSKIVGPSKYSSKIIFKSILNILSNKWELNK